MSHPDRLPDLFVDRSLGRVTVPRLLREHGLRLTTLAERYGVPADEKITDVEWLGDAGRNGEAVLMKDEMIAHRPAERVAVVEHSVRCFCLARKDLSGPAMANEILQNLPAITDACGEDASGVWIIRRQGLRRLL